MIKRCIGAGRDFGFLTSFASIEDFGFQKSGLLVRSPGDLGRLVAMAACRRGDPMARSRDGSYFSSRDRSGLCCRHAGKCATDEHGLTRINQLDFATPFRIM